MSIIKLNYKSHVENFSKTSTVCFAFSTHQEMILIQIERIFILLLFYLNKNHLLMSQKSKQTVEVLIKFFMWLL